MADPAPANHDGEGGDGEAGIPFAARRLLRAARAGTLATATGGQPFAALVTPACAPDLSPLLLLSTLSEHTRHLQADGRCALMVSGASAETNPQTAPRVTVTCTATPDPDPALRARYLAIHPYAALYADFGDFAIWRLRPGAALYVGGFALARRLGREALLPNPEAVARIAAAETDILGHCNADHADALAAIARAQGGAARAWRMVAADGDGCDLAAGETVLRIAWAAPARDARSIRAELVGMARRAREGAGPAPA